MEMSDLAKSTLDFIRPTNKRTIESIKIGDEIAIFPASGYSNHMAYITVTKINPKSFKGIERKGSMYPDTPWTISKKTEFALISYENGYMKTQWFNTANF